MNANDLSILSSRPRVDAMPHMRVVGAYLQEMRTELLRYLRNPGFLLPTLLFPTVFYVMCALHSKWMGANNSFKPNPLRGSA
jgi:hypothetical protein